MNKARIVLPILANEDYSKWLSRDKRENIHPLCLVTNGILQLGGHFLKPNARQSFGNMSG